MALIWAAAFILFVIIVIRKEHLDRKKPVLVGELVSGAGFGPTIKKTLAKSWYEQMKEFAKSLITAGGLIGIGWLLHALTGLTY